MFVHLGGDTLVGSKDIIAIINYENNTKNNVIQDFLKRETAKQTIKKLEGESYKSIIIADKNIFLSPISSTTLKKRAHFVENLNQY